MAGLVMARAEEGDQADTTEPKMTGHAHGHAEPHDHAEHDDRDELLDHNADEHDHDAVIHVNPCSHDGEDAHALTRHHDPLAGGAALEVSEGGHR